MIAFRLDVMPRSLLIVIATGPSSIHATFRVPICMLLLEATLLIMEERAAFIGHVA